MAHDQTMITPAAFSSPLPTVRRNIHVVPEGIRC